MKRCSAVGIEIIQTICCYIYTGAMENWGLVTYRETALLVDPKNSASSAKQRVALVVGHELAHQWFGNLVTMVGYEFKIVLSYN